MRLPNKGMSSSATIGIAITCVLAIVPLIVIAQASVIAQTKRATIRLVNRSDWDIHHLYLSPVSSNKWGPDQLGEAVLESGSSFTLTDIPCAEYDIKVVDEDGDTCIIEDVALCREDAVWNLTNEELLSCEGFGT